MSNPFSGTCQLLFSARSFNEADEDPDPALWGAIGLPTGYERVVMELRKGDRVRYDDEEFVLGEFVGAGNATHLYRLQNKPGLLRIPFLVGNAIENVCKECELERTGDRLDPVRMQALRLKTILHLSKEYSSLMQRRAGAIEVLQSDPKGRFNRVEEVTHSEPALTFLRMVLLRGNFLLGDILQYPGPDFFPHPPGALARQLTQLIDLMKRNGHAKEGNTPGTVAVSTLAARQYHWSLDQNVWKVVDAE